MKERLLLLFLVLALLSGIIGLGFFQHAHNAKVQYYSNSLINQ